VLVANLVIPAFYAARYLKAFNIPVIGVMHSNDTFYKGVIKKFIHASAVNQLDVSVSVSNYINNLVEANNNNTQALVIPCGTPKSKAQTHRVAKDKLKVIYAGRLEIQQKQILKLTEAFVNASVTNSRLEFSIYGSGSQKSQLTSILENFKSLHHTEYKGAVKPSEMLDVMAKHHVFTLMSDYEGMPVALMEAMSCGVVPVCLHEESGINEIIEHGVNGFIVKDRSEDYQEKLKLLADDKALWTTMSKNAIETIKQYYSSDITNKKWFDLLQQFKNLAPKKVHMPFKVILTGNLLHYGDNRKPTFTNRLQNNLKQQWMNLRLFVRPRVRLRAILKHQKNKV
jgi:glycosyltransferase involved in cell wall biosynthesis